MANINIYYLVDVNDYILDISTSPIVGGSGPITVDEDDYNIVLESLDNEVYDVYKIISNNIDNSEAISTFNSRLSEISGKRKLLEKIYSVIDGGIDRYDIESVLKLLDLPDKLFIKIIEEIGNGNLEFKDFLPILASNERYTDLIKNFMEESNEYLSINNYKKQRFISFDSGLKSNFIDYIKNIFREEDIDSKYQSSNTLYNSYIYSDDRILNINNSISFDDDKYLRNKMLRSLMFDTGTSDIDIDNILISPIDKIYLPTSFYNQYISIIDKEYMENNAINIDRMKKIKSLNKYIDTAKTIYWDDMVGVDYLSNNGLTISESGTSGYVKSNKNFTNFKLTMTAHSNSYINDYDLIFNNVLKIENNQGDASVYIGLGLNSTSYTFSNESDIVLIKYNNDIHVYDSTDMVTHLFKITIDLENGYIIEYDSVDSEVRRISTNISGYYYNNNIRINVYDTVENITYSNYLKGGV
jgi:hypothetical protein